MKISVIIPTLNEKLNLQELIPLLKRELQHLPHEIIVVDGGSNDGSEEYCKESAIHFERTEKSCRAIQMNYGAKLASGEILYFVHADTRPLPGFYQDILNAMLNGHQAGCYRYRFDQGNFLLRINGWFTRFNGLFSGGGDQTLFIHHSIFKEIGGFDEEYCIMEDFELVRRIKKYFRFHIIPRSILVSARKYEQNSWIKVQWANLVAFLYFMKNRDPREIRDRYHKMLTHR
ncbi:TIGR04283 family arsenosugar biosynthesis glycosyltransferase [Algoriphagus hitonicola]|uniref:Transferase 2, rSAM/selenodomain-associated n=1 Tax=Algoriphagus hitonicola TaxID=435880 RepID=A0A1I2RA30_9BACT|nr:TIGR04283 family arsenosugar biosynthesis glycosyltransferase [Algoriphagus hitonicola]SFG37320.1 transferase 2, rSAM/selenodomain-associated [Algoriphagus hitonicola]